jgi:hypothetical protein
VNDVAVDVMAFTPIKALNLFAKDWCVRARVTQKFPLRQTNKGGSILKCVLLDALSS